MPSRGRSKKKVFPVRYLLVFLAGGLTAVLIMVWAQRGDRPAVSVAGPWTSPVSLTSDQLAWGESQLRQMLKDRPAMAPYVKPGDDLWVWTAQQFAGAGGAGEVQWDAVGTTPPWDAMSCRAWPKKHKLAWVEVTANLVTGFGKYPSGTPKTGPTLWNMLIFEFLNISHSHRGSKVDTKAAEGLLDRTAFILESGIQEHDTAQDANRFFREFWTPHCQKLKLPYQDDQLTGRMGFIFQIPYVEDDIDDMLKHRNDPTQWFGKLYDEKYRRTYLKHQEELRKNKAEADSIPPPPSRE